MKRALLAAGVALGVAGAALASTPRALCACTSVQSAYSASMKADLRDLVTAQEMFFNDSLRYAGSIAELTGHGFQLSKGIEFVSLRAREGGFDARVRLPSRTTIECSVASGTAAAGPAEDGNPSCTPPPPSALTRTLALVYFALLLAALALRMASVGRGFGPFDAGTIAGFALLTLVHPFWPPVGAGGDCATSADIPAVLLMAAVTVFIGARGFRTSKRVHGGGDV